MSSVETRINTQVAAQLEQFQSQITFQQAASLAEQTALKADTDMRQNRLMATLETFMAGFMHRDRTGKGATAEDDF